MTPQSRRGRPPVVHPGPNAGEYFTSVRGVKYAFRKGGDKRLRGLGNMEHSADYLYAKEQVEAFIAQVEEFIDSASL